MSQQPLPPWHPEWQIAAWEAEANARPSRFPDDIPGYIWVGVQRPDGRGSTWSLEAVPTDWSRVKQGRGRKRGAKDPTRGSTYDPLQPRGADGRFAGARGSQIGGERLDAGLADPNVALPVPGAQWARVDGGWQLQEQAKPAPVDAAAGRAAEAYDALMAARAERIKVLEAALDRSDLTRGQLARVRVELAREREGIEHMKSSKPAWLRHLAAVAAVLGGGVVAVLIAMFVSRRQQNPESQA